MPLMGPIAHTSLISNAEVTYNFGFCPPRTFKATGKYEQHQNDALARIIDTMDRRATNLWYGLGYGIGQVLNISQENDSLQHEHESGLFDLNEKIENADESCAATDEFNEENSVTSANHQSTDELIELNNDEPYEEEQVCPVSNEPTSSALPVEEDSESSSYFDYISSIMDYIVESIKEFTHLSVTKIRGVISFQVFYEQAKPAQSTESATCTLQKNTPQAVMLRSNLPMIEKIFNDKILGVRTKRENLLNKLSQYYQTHASEIKNIAGMCKVLEDASLSGPIKLLIMDYPHGTPSTLKFGAENIDVDNFFNQKQDLSCLKLMAPDVKIVLASCDTARDYHYQFENGDIVSMNVQKLFAHYLPGATVYAADFTVLKGSLDISVQPVFRAEAHGTDITDTMQHILEPARLLENLYKLNKSYLGITLYYLGYQAPTHRAMIEISPRNSTLQMQPYFSMKKHFRLDEPKIAIQSETTKEIHVKKIITNN